LKLCQAMFEQFKRYRRQFPCIFFFNKIRAAEKTMQSNYPSEPYPVTFSTTRSPSPSLSLRLPDRHQALRIPKLWGRRTSCSTECPGWMLNAQVYCFSSLFFHSPISLSLSTSKQLKIKLFHSLLLLIYIIYIHNGLEVNSASNRNEYQESSWGLRTAGA
jgi:hypothetical protein